MKKSIIFRTFTVFFFSLCFVYFADAKVTAEVTPDFDENDYPQGAPTHTFDFIVDMTIKESPHYHTIRVKLTPSKFKGIAANAGNKVEPDLYFHGPDNIGWQVVDATTLEWAYHSMNTKLPSGFQVRCRDFGAHADVHFTVSNSQVDEKLHIPIDVNGNDIADGWEKAHGIYVADKVAAQSVAKADVEKGPFKDDGGTTVNINKHDGDGWVVYDEYRGLYTTFVNNKPAGYMRLDPRRKDVIYSSDASMKKYGIGSIPAKEYGLDRKLKDPIHTFTHVDEALFHPDHPVFTEIYKYDAQGKVSHKKDVSDLLGRVNYNSNPGGTATQVPDAEDVWAIRIVAETDEDTSKKTPGRYGHITTGSPHKYSLAKIFTRNIKLRVTQQWENIVNGPFPFPNDVKAKAETHIDTAVDDFTAYVVSHEVLHGLNAHTHCKHLNCVMYSEGMYAVPTLVFLNDGAFGQIKVTINDDPELDPNEPGISKKEKEKRESRPYEKWVTNKKGHVILLDHPEIHEYHLEGSAVTGSPTGEISNGPSVVIGYYYENADADAGDNEVGDAGTTTPTTPTTPTTTTPSVSLVSSDGVYTASAGDKHTAKVTAPEAIYSVTWYIASPGTTGRGTFAGSTPGDGSATTADLDYTFPSGVSGDYRITAAVYKHADMSLLGEVSYTVSVSLPSPPVVSVPVWSDIPGPYKLPVWERFRLDVSQYVSGDPTISVYGGRLPFGLSLSNGVLSGTPEFSGQRALITFRAANTGGVAYSNRVLIYTVSKP